MRRLKKLIPSDPKAIGKSVKRKEQRNKKSAKKHGEHHGHGSVRTATHNGFEIEVETSYVIRVNGKPLNVHAHVLDNGYVHSSALPNYGWQSAVDFVRQLIDSFPDDFAGYKKAKGKKKKSKKKKTKRKAVKKKAAKKKRKATKTKSGTKKKTASKKKPKNSRLKKSKAKQKKKRKSGSRSRTR